ncbi:MAG: DUF3307 domain-containing protein [Gillisia sp.]
MENLSITILMQLLLAHIFTDFMLQPNHWIAHKRKHKGKSFYLVIHALLAGILSYVFLMHWEWWYIAVFISISHYLIDFWKLNSNRDDLTYFLLDQLLHLLMILVAWLYLIQGFSEVLPQLQHFFSSPKVLIIIAAYLSVVFPAGFFIGKATQRWQKEIDIQYEATSLDAAGRYIGIFERLLVLTFILTGNFSAIGFLIAAKSILRFSDKSDSGARKQTEYVLIGTLISFSISIFAGLLVRHFLF